MAVSLPEKNHLSRHDYQQKNPPSIVSFFAINAMCLEYDAKQLSTRPSLQSPEPTRKIPETMTQRMIPPIATRPSLQSLMSPYFQLPANDACCEPSAKPGYVPPAQDVPLDTASSNRHSCLTNPSGSAAGSLGNSDHASSSPAARTSSWPAGMPGHYNNADSSDGDWEQSISHIHYMVSFP